MDDFIEVPILAGFDITSLPVGFVRIRKDALPDTPDWVLSLGFKVLEQKDNKGVKYELLQFGLVTDSNFREYLDRRP